MLKNSYNTPTRTHTEKMTEPQKHAIERAIAILTWRSTSLQGLETDPLAQKCVEEDRSAAEELRRMIGAQAQEQQAEQGVNPETER